MVEQRVASLAVNSAVQKAELKAGTMAVERVDLWVASKAAERDVKKVEH